MKLKGAWVLWTEALQMGGVSLILLVSLVLYIHYQPYKASTLNPKH